jgi:hypothetical protein
MLSLLSNGLGKQFGLDAAVRKTRQAYARRVFSFCGWGRLPADGLRWRRRQGL